MSVFSSKPVVPNMWVEPPQRVTGFFGGVLVNYWIISSIQMKENPLLVDLVTVSTHAAKKRATNTGFVLRGRKLKWLGTTALSI